MKVMKNESANQMFLFTHLNLIFCMFNILSLILLCLIFFTVTGLGKKKCSTVKEIHLYSLKWRYRRIQINGGNRPRCLCFIKGSFRILTFLQERHFNEPLKSLFVTTTHLCCSPESWVGGAWLFCCSSNKQQGRLWFCSWQICLLLIFKSL